MKKSIFILLVVCACLAVSCKKEYVCECSNPGGTFKAFNIRDSKGNAEQKCKEYYEDNYGDVVFNETHCEIK